MLTISRPDIDSRSITEFPLSSRFIKLPIVPYLKLVKINGKTAWDEINNPQIALINAINSPKYRFVCAALCRRLGKTIIANIVGQLVSLVPNCNILIVSPNYNLSSISFEIQRKLIKQFDLEITRDNLKDRLIELSNGSTIRMGSVSTIDSTVGRSYDLIIFDEAALSEGGEEAFNVALRPTLDKINSKAIFISTPRGKRNWFSKFFERGFSLDFKEWISITADYLENPRMSEADVEEARRSMSAAEFAQEYMASFVTFEGRIYTFEDEQIEDYVPNDSDIFFAGLDPGYRDPTACIILAYREQTEEYFVVDEYLSNESTTSVHANAIKNLLEKWNVQDGLFIDHAAAQFAADLANDYDIATIKARKDVLPGIRRCQTIVENKRLKVSPHCTHTLDFLYQYRWDVKDTTTKEKPLHDEFSHMADAMRYAIYTFII